MGAERWSPRALREEFFALPGEFGVAVQDSVLRKSPSWKENMHDGCDLNQESGVPSQEPLRIISSGGVWMLVETYYARGYIPAEDVMPVAAEDLHCAVFLTVTGAHVMGERKENLPVWFPMGVFLPLEEEAENHFGVRVACRQGNAAAWETVRIAKSEDVVKGYLRSSPQLVLRQAKKQLGHLYDWGGRWGGVDCSALVMMIYRCFGIFLPRNTGQQREIGTIFSFREGMTAGERVAALCRAKPGDLLYMPGHVAIWLGKKEKMLQILHASYTKGEICIQSMNVTHKNAQEFLFKLEKINRIP